MADYNHDVKIQIEAFLKDIGLNDAKKRLDALSDSTHKAEQAFDRAEVSASSFMSVLTGALAAGAVAAFVRSSVIEFAKLDRSLSAISLKMTALGMDSEKNLPKVKSYLSEIQDAGGPIVGETVPAFSKFIGITKDVNAALAATKLAIDISEGASIELGTASQYVAGMMQGRAAPAAQALGIEIYDLNGQLKSNAEILEEVIKLYGGMADRTDDAQDSIDKLSNSWDKIKIATGEAIAPLVNWIAKIVDGINAVQRMRRSLGELDEEGTKALKSIGSNARISDIFVSQSPRDPFQKSPGDQANIAQAQRKDREEQLKFLFDLMKAEQQENNQELRDAARKRDQESRDQKQKTSEERRAYAERSRLELAWQEEQSKWYEDQDRQLEKAVADWDEYYKMRSDLSEGFEKRELERALDYATRGSEEWLALKYQQLQSYYDKQKAFIDANIRDEEDRKRLLAQLEKELNELKTQADREGALQRDQIRQAEKEASVTAAQVVVGALASAFPQVKGFQVAMALLNLLSAAMKAAEAASIGGPGAAIAAYAAVFAALIGVISAMKSVSPGSSGTGSGRGGGGGRQRTNVVQFAPNATRDEQMSYYQQHRRGGNATTIVQNFNGTLVDSDQALKKLNRELRRANRRDDERFIR